MLISGVLSITTRKALSFQVLRDPMQCLGLGTQSAMQESTVTQIIQTSFLISLAYM